MAMESGGGWRMGVLDTFLCYDGLLELYSTCGGLLFLDSYVVRW